MSSFLDLRKCLCVLIGFPPNVSTCHHWLFAATSKRNTILWWQVILLVKSADVAGKKADNFWASKLFFNAPCSSKPFWLLLLLFSPIFIFTDFAFLVSFECQCCDNMCSAHMGNICMNWGHRMWRASQALWKNLYTKKLSLEGRCSCWWNHWELAGPCSPNQAVVTLFSIPHYSSSLPPSLLLIQ